MRKINMNKVAKLVSEWEGKKKEVDIAQIKEVVSIFLDILADEWQDNAAGVVELITR